MCPRVGPLLLAFVCCASGLWACARDLRETLPAEAPEAVEWCDLSFPNGMVWSGACTVRASAASVDVAPVESAAWGPIARLSARPTAAGTAQLTALSASGTPLWDSTAIRDASGWQGVGLVVHVRGAAASATPVVEPSEWAVVVAFGPGPDAPQVRDADARLAALSPVLGMTVYVGPGSCGADVEDDGLEGRTVVLALFSSRLDALVFARSLQPPPMGVVPRSAACGGT